MQKNISVCLANVGAETRDMKDKKSNSLRDKHKHRKEKENIEIDCHRRKRGSSVHSWWT